MYLVFQNGSRCAGDGGGGGGVAQCNSTKMAVCTLCIRTVLGMPVTCVRKPSVIMLT